MEGKQSLVSKVVEDELGTVWNHVLVFNNNTSASFDTTPYGVQFARNKFSRYETKNIVNWFRMLHNTLRLLPWNRTLVFNNNTSATILTHAVLESSNKFDRFDPTPAEYRSLETSSRDLES